MAEATHVRKGHVIADAGSRLRKASKIEALLSARADLSACDVLDLGAGAGHISRHFAKCARSVTAVDRDAGDFDAPGVPFEAAPGLELPFADDLFDVVIYNHVIEHVGGRAEQARHLAEIRRVLRPGGLLYLAVPSRWAPVEPHYRLPFLSWLPQGLADRMVRASGRGAWYDCTPFGPVELRRILAAAGFEARDATGEALRHFARHEAGPGTVGAAARAVAALPDAALDLVAPAMPTYVFVGRSLKRREAA